MIGNVSYEVTMGLPKGSTYFGHVVVNFILRANSSNNTNNSLFIDFLGNQISNLAING